MLQTLKKDCRDIHNKIMNIINGIDYELSSKSQSKQPTIKDLFLNDKNSGQRCAELLCKYVRCLSQLLIRKLCNEGGINEPCLQYLFCKNAVKEVIDKDGTVRISFEGLDDSIDCQTIVRIADALSKSTGISSTPLLEDFGSYTRTPPSESEDDTLRTGRSKDSEDIDETGEFDLDIEFNDDQELPPSHNPNNEGLCDTASKNDKSAIKPEDTRASKNARKHEFTELRKSVSEKCKAISKYCEENPSLCEDYKAAIAYITSRSSAPKIIGCDSVDEARRKAFYLEDIQREPYPFVYIKEPGDAVAQFFRPSVPGILRSQSAEKNVEFHVDTGADEGSKAFTSIDELIKLNFTLTIQNVNGELQPAILCKVEMGDDRICSERVLVFDLDPDRREWNAIGLKTLLNFILTLDIKNERVDIQRHGAVSLDFNSFVSNIKSKYEI